MVCPRCRAAMSQEVLAGHPGTSVTIDLCLPCQMFWFDTHESLQLSPAAVLKLFRIIGDQALAARPAITNEPLCPRCNIQLVLTHDLQRNTRFQYLRCPWDHGRLIAFVDFLREKDFIRPLSPQQIEELRQTVQTVNCSNCGAPIDLATHSECPHCRSPLSMLDLKRAGALVSELRALEQPKPLDPALPLNLARARAEVDNAFASFQHGPGWTKNVEQNGLIEAGLSALARWIKNNE
jgi:Zn-finger nucleic acid-binding protein